MVNDTDRLVFAMQIVTATAVHVALIANETITFEVFVHAVRQVEHGSKSVAIFHLVALSFEKCAVVVVSKAVVFTETGGDDGVIVNVFWSFVYGYFARRDGEFLVAGGRVQPLVVVRLFYIFAVVVADVTTISSHHFGCDHSEVFSTVD